MLVGNIHGNTIYMQDNSKPLAIPKRCHQHPTDPQSIHHCNTHRSLCAMAYVDVCRCVTGRAFGTVCHPEPHQAPPVGHC